MALKKDEASGLSDKLGASQGQTDRTHTLPRGALATSRGHRLRHGLSTRGREDKLSPRKQRNKL